MVRARNTQDPPLSTRNLHDRLDELLDGRSREELVALLHALGEDRLPREREGFLRRLKAHLDSPTSTSAGDSGDDLAEAIERFAEELRELTPDIVEAGLCQDLEEDMDPSDIAPGILVMATFEELLERIGQILIEAQDPARAQHYYDQLWAALDQGGTRDHPLPLWELDRALLREHAARYLRAVYAAADPEDRPEALLKAAPYTRLLRPEPRGPVLDDSASEAITLAEIRDVLRQPPPDWDVFLGRAAEVLWDDPSPLADRWLREAVAQRQGHEGLLALAEREGTARPYAWLDAAETASASSDLGQLGAILARAEAHLPPEAPIWARMADRLLPGLTESGADEAGIARLAERAWIAEPRMDRLADLCARLEPGERAIRLREAGNQVRRRPRTSELPESPSADASFPGSKLIEPRPTAVLDSAAVALALLLGGDWEGARALDRGDEASVSRAHMPDSQRMVIAYLMLALQGGEVERMGTLSREIWKEMRDPGPGGRLGMSFGRAFHLSSMDALVMGPDDDEGMDEPEEEEAQDPHDPELERWLWVQDAIDRAAAEACATQALTTEQADTWLRWCLGTIRSYTEEVLSNKQRRHYKEVAELLVAGQEVASGCGRGGEGEALLEDIQCRFSRHSAFKTDLRNALVRAQVHRGA
ncbi:MAG: hypothetical protein ACLFRW_07295 [Halorhodospira sp.]